MTSKRMGVATQFKDQVNPLLTSVHYMVHRTNFVALDATKTPNCKELSKDIDNIINVVAGHLKKSLK